MNLTSSLYFIKYFHFQYNMVQLLQEKDTHTIIVWFQVHLYINTIVQQYIHIIDCDINYFSMRPCINTTTAVILQYDSTTIRIYSNLEPTLKLKYGTTTIRIQCQVKPTLIFQYGTTTIRIQSQVFPALILQYGTTTILLHYQVTPTLQYDTTTILLHY